MRFIYDILFTAGFIIASPFYFFKMWRRGNWRAGFKQRFGEFDNKVKQSLTNRHVLWMHAVSVGEINVCMQLIKALEPRLPNLKIVVSTTTSTGMGEMQKRLPTHIGKIYYPIDRYRYVSRAQALIHPDAIVLVESEIWPNFIWRAKSRGTPLILANARLSGRSYPRYKKFGALFRPLFGAFVAVGAQNAGDAAKLRELGCDATAVQVAGNLKFDSALLTDGPELNVPALLAQLGIPAGAPLLVAGSTHAGEEKILAEQFLRLREKFPQLVLILVPRHFERARDVGQELGALGVKFVYRKDINSRTAHAPGSVQCLVVNTTGELRHFYEHATIAFVGKSLIAKGGQNPIEPAVLGKAVVFGPNMQNFTDVTRIFLERQAVVQVSGAAELESAFAELLGNPKRREELGEKARQTVLDNQGGVDRTVEMIVEQFRRLNVYIVPKKTEDGEPSPGK